MVVGPMRTELGISNRRGTKRLDISDVTVSTLSSDRHSAVLRSFEVMGCSPRRRRGL
jgi:hypothetical protein